MAGWQWFGRLHSRVYRATGGAFGGNLIGLQMLLLTTRGRKSGQLRTSPLPFYLDGADWVVVGSNGGALRDPAWWLNLQVEPEAQIQVRRERIQVRAMLASPEERDRLWPLLKDWNTNYKRYETLTDREIPVVVLRRSA